MEFRIDLGNERAEMELLRELPGVEISHRCCLDLRRIDSRVLDRLASGFGDQIADRFPFLLQVALKVSSAPAENVNRFHSRWLLRVAKEARASAPKHRAKRSKLQIPNPKEAPSSRLQKSHTAQHLELEIWCLGFGASRANAR